MAKKAFEIQGSDLSLGGVNLQAGTNGVVIPGITQAANYFVEEVNDTSVDQNVQFVQLTVVIDAVTYNALSTSQSIATYSSYTVEVDDDFYIDEIKVASRGTYTQQEKTTNETTDMWAYTGLVDPFTTPFDEFDWIQVPFRPRMRADEVTTIGGGSGSRVKLESPGDRRIEEVYGYIEVSVTGRTTTGTITTTAAASNTGNTNTVSIDAVGTAYDDLIALANGPVEYTIQVSLDDNNWYNGYISGWDGSTSVDIGLSNSVTMPVAENDTVYYRTYTGGDPVVWWNAAELPAGSSGFRGAVIDYHAFTGDATWVGTIHIVDDDGEENITHTEVSSGSTDGENDDLWLVTKEGQIKYRRIDGESATLKIQWSAKVFYGSEIYD
jgi:hypothetical protein